MNNAGIWREAEKSQPFFIPAVTPLLPSSPPPLPTYPGVAGNERQKEAERLHTYSVPAVALEMCQKQNALWNTDRKEKEKRKKEQHAPLSVLARDGWRDNALSVVDCGWRQSRAGQNKEGNSFFLPLPPTHSLQASNKAVDYYNLNQPFKATTGMFATTRFFLPTGVLLSFGMNPVRIFHL